jgi:hypothetical protein
MPDADATEILKAQERALSNLKDFWNGGHTAAIR